MNLTELLTALAKAEPEKFEITVKTEMGVRHNGGGSVALRTTHFKVLGTRHSAMICHVDEEDVVSLSSDVADEIVGELGYVIEVRFDNFSKTRKERFETHVYGPFSYAEPEWVQPNHEEKREATLAGLCRAIELYLSSKGKHTNGELDKREVAAKYLCEALAGNHPIWTHSTRRTEWFKWGTATVGILKSDLKCVLSLRKANP